MSFWLVSILSLSILIPAALGVIRYSKISRVFHPFIYCIWLGAVVEIGSNVLAYNGYSNAVVSNIFVLVEAVLLTWQFKKWQLFKQGQRLFLVMISVFVVTWILESFIISKLTHFISYFRILYSFAVVLMSIAIVNGLIIRERKNLLKNPVFILCAAFIFYYTIQVLVEAFWLYGVEDKEFGNNVYYISVITNFMTNLLYSIAILWMPAKQRFTLPSS